MSINVRHRGVNFSRILFSDSVDWKSFRVRILVVIPLLLLHIGAFASIFFFTWSAFIGFLVMTTVTGMLGVTVGYHRMVTHNSFQTYPVIRALHMAAASISFQQGPISWARVHRAHHLHSDNEQDPHPQQYGFFFGHMGWSFLSHKKIGRSTVVSKAPKDLTKHRDLRFFEKYHVLLNILFLAACFAVGGLPWLCWVGCFRIVWLMHWTWTINSICHRWGYRNYETADKSKNFPPLILVSYGECWHNNHHRFPNSARHGLRKHEVDPSWLWISMLGKLGLAWNIKTPNEIRYKRPNPTI